MKRDPNEEILGLLKESVPKSRWAPALTSETTLMELGLDSLTLASIVISFCESAGIDIEVVAERDWGDVSTVGDLQRAAMDLLGTTRSSE